jgi:acetyl-CoA acetyltransferase
MPEDGHRGSNKAFVSSGGWDIHDVPGTAALRRLGREWAGVARRRSRFMAIYAAFAQFHMRQFTTREQIAAVAAKNHGHSVHNPRAQDRKPFTVSEILAGRPVVGPLTVPMCAPLSDGAAAAVLCSESALHRFSQRRSVSVLASVLRSGAERPPEALDRHVSGLAAARHTKWLASGDVSVAEVR